MPGPKYPNAQTEAEWFGILTNGLDRVRKASDHRWWLHAAVSCIDANHAQLITSRDGSVVYMLRCWLSHPQPCTAGQTAKYESGNSVLLHWILQPDDIPYLHNHPWEFTTRILSGGYTEQRDIYGTLLTYERHPPAFAFARLGDFHRIACHLDGNGDPHTGQGGTWSLVTTGQRVQPWSFLINGCERDAETFLRRKHDQEAAVTQTRLDLKP